MKDRAILFFRVLILLALCILIASAVHYTQAADVLSKYGSRGAEVTAIQTRLKRWGYYFGDVDGIYGSQTRDAVIWFQRKHGLKVDGIAGPETLEAIGLPTGIDPGGSGGTVTTADEQLLAHVISAEARGESLTGQIAVGAVVLNRVAHPSFPDTIAGVIYQKGAFTAVTNSQWQQPIAASAYTAARQALAGYDPSGGAIYYYNPAKTTNAFMLSRPIITVIGNHRFCS